MSGSAADPAHPARDRAGAGGGSAPGGREAGAAGGREPLPLAATDAQVRAALAARFLALAARSAPLPEAELLSAHLRRWGSRLPAHLRDGSALGPIVQQLLEVIAFQFDEIPSWSQAAAAVGELADDAGRAIGVMGAGTGGRRALDLLHIDVNRLGLNPAEECIAGLCARQLLTGGAVPPAQPSAAVG